jgi:2-polyprenyl-6-methoxyphenol hydroxylase-like FAD-dependent oxidoreductase
MKKVIVAGCGAAGSFLALRALQLGFEPTMLRAPIRAVGGVEIVPASAWRLLDALGLDGRPMAPSTLCKDARCMSIG